MNKSYFIEGFPVPFHSITEILEFLESLSVPSLYLFSCSRICFEDHPLAWILVGEKEIAGPTFLSYRLYPI